MVVEKCTTINYKEYKISGGAAQAVTAPALKA
jgi:hypothetical protein